MDMVQGRISPTGGQQGHGHPLSSVFASDSLMRYPSQAVIDQINAATTIALLRAALTSWIGEQPGSVA